MSSAHELPSPAQFRQGVTWALVTVLLWAGWAIMTRIGVTHALTPMDIAFLRYTTAGLILLPVAIRYLPTLRAARPRDVALMVLGAGAPYGILTGIGFMYAPAVHSVLIPGTMPLWVALLSCVFFGERLPRMRLAGLAVILGSAVFKLAVSASGDGVLLADGLFLLSAALWAIYTVTVRRTPFSGLAATSYVALFSMLLMAIPYAVYQWQRPHALPVGEAVAQLLYQGILVSIVSLLTYTRAIALLGAARAAAFAALVPVMVTVLAIPLLGEHPSLADGVFVAALSLGVLLATGARPRLPRFFTSAPQIPESAR